MPQKVYLNAKKASQLSPSLQINTKLILSRGGGDRNLYNLSLFLRIYLA